MRESPRRSLYEGIDPSWEVPKDLLIRLINTENAAELAKFRKQLNGLSLHQYEDLFSQVQTMESIPMSPHAASVLVDEMFEAPVRARRLAPNDAYAAYPFKAGVLPKFRYSFAPFVKDKNQGRSRLAEETATAVVQKIDDVARNSHDLMIHDLRELLTTFMPGTQPLWLVDRMQMNMNKWFSARSRVAEPTEAGSQNPNDSYNEYHYRNNWISSYQHTLFNGPSEFWELFEKQFLLFGEHASVEHSGQQLRTLRELFARGVDPEEQESAADKLRDLSVQYQGSWLVKAYADHVTGELDRKEVLGHHYVRSSSVLPFKISKSQYAMLAYENEMPALLVSNSSQQQNIETAFDELRNAEEVKRPVDEKIAALYGAYGHLYKEEWPMDATSEEYDLYQGAEMQRYKKAEESLRSFFMQGWSKPLPERRIDLREVFGRVAHRLATEGGVTFDTLQELFSEDVRSVIEKELGIPLQELTLEEQFVFLSYALQTKAGEGSQLKSFIEKYQTPGLRSFLATALDETLGQKILEFSKDANPEDVNRIFSAFGIFADRVEKLEEYLVSTFGDNKSKDVHAITEKILSRGRDLLGKAHEYRRDPKKLEALLENIDADAQIFLDSCRVLQRQGTLSLENIRDTVLEIHSGDISETDANAILKIQEERYRGKYPDAMLGELQGSLSDALKSPFGKFYLYRKNGEIITYVRFDQLNASSDPDRKHMASFMTNPKFEGGALGQAMLELALEKEFEKGAVYAECDPSLVPFYEKFGFIKLRQYKDEHGVDTCDIVLEPQAEVLREAA